MRLLPYVYLLTACIAFIVVSKVAAHAGDGCEKPFYPPHNMNCNPKTWKPSDKRYCKGTQNGHGFWLSSQEPMAKHAGPAMVRSVDTFQGILAQVSEAVIEKRRRNKMLPRCAIRSDFIDDGATRRADYERQQSWKYAAINNQKNFGLHPTASHCFTQIEMNATRSRYVWEKMRAHHRQMEITGRKILRYAKSNTIGASGGVRPFFKRSVGCWSDIFSPNARNISTNNFQCTVMHVAGSRRPKTATDPSGKFNIFSPLTNAPPTLSMEERARIYISEVWTVAEGADGRKMVRGVNTTAIRHGDIERPTVIPETTTRLATWGGRILVSMFMGIPTAEGPAMQAVMDKSAKNRDLLDDGTFPSNIALLVLPAVLALVPASHFEMMDTVSYMMVYALAADVFAVLPLGIKGVEMLIRTRETFTSCVAWNMGSELSEGLAIIELWCTACENHMRYRRYGTGLLVTAVVLLVVGFVIEYVAYKWSKKHRIRKRKKIMLRCLACNCDSNYGNSNGNVEEDEISLVKTTGQSSNWSTPWGNLGSPRFLR